MFISQNIKKQHWLRSVYVTNLLGAFGGVHYLMFGVAKRKEKAAFKSLITLV